GRLKNSASGTSPRSTTCGRAAPPIRSAIRVRSSPSGRQPALTNTLRHTEPASVDVYFYTCHRSLRKTPEPRRLPPFQRGRSHRPGDGRLAATGLVFCQEPGTRRRKRRVRTGAHLPVLL